MSARLPIVSEAIDLAKVHIASPCDQNWEDMSGDKHVHNFAQMSRLEIGLVLKEELHTDAKDVEDFPGKLPFTRRIFDSSRPTQLGT